MQTTQIEQLPCKLTGEEVLLKSDALAHAHEQLERLRAEKASATSSFASAIKTKEQEIAKLAKEVRSREEERSVECIERPRYGDMMVDLIRLDTGLKVSSRGMHPHERQSALELGDALPPPKKEQPKRKAKGSASTSAKTASKGRKGRVRAKEDDENDDGEEGITGAH